jgi:hypothetical protein
MIKNAFSPQLIADLTNRSRKASLPSSLRDVAKKGDFSDMAKVQDALEQEIQSASLQSNDEVDHFLFMVKETLLFHFFRFDQEGFDRSIEIVKRRLDALRKLPSTEVNIAAWEQYMELLTVSFSRLLKHKPLEVFEEYIGKIEWNRFANTSFISSISTVLGFVYLSEPSPEQVAKARLWLQKSLNESSLEANLTNHLLMVDMFLAEGGDDNSNRATTLVDELQEAAEGIEDEAMQAIFDATIFLLRARQLVHVFAHFNDTLTRLEHCQLQLKELESRFSQREHLPAFFRAAIEGIIGKLYTQLYGMTDDGLEKSSFNKHAVQHADKGVEWAESFNDSYLVMYYRLLRAEMAVDTSFGSTEKEIKEVVQYFKKRNDYPMYIRANHTFVTLFDQKNAAQKSYDVIIDIFKQGNKNFDLGGFYMVSEGLALANKVFHNEINKPGVSWVVHDLDNFFDRLRKVIDNVEEAIDTIGTSLVEAFREEYINFEPVSHFNIKVYYLYQFYSIKMMRLGALINQDKNTLRVADNLLAELQDEANPLSFVQANWEEFKKVPNSVRNCTLNKCINISKGDLPLAAEHLDFSYRNLRSYITFKEVNRLGFFLEMQQTTNRQLEQGIRYMFHDLYKSGTIFEVVFDMPRFLVEYAQSGFFSQDLERELDIKGTTAKKYIKIMMEIGLIRQDKTTGRKHYYRLIRENVMNRLGKDQTTLISPAETK